MDECKPLNPGSFLVIPALPAAWKLGVGQGLTLVPISAQLELVCPPHNLT
jgi:hypothetical protein